MIRHIVLILSFFTCISLCAKSISEQDWNEAKKEYTYQKKTDQKQPTKPKQQISESNKERSPILDNLLTKEVAYAFILIIILSLLALMLKNFTIPTKQLKPISENTPIINIEERLMETDMDELIRMALEENNFQLAIRYTFLKTLKALVKKNKLIWKKQYTNRDYLFQLYDTQYFEPFKSAIFIYERKWYRNDISDKYEYEKYNSECTQICNLK